MGDASKRCATNGWHRTRTLICMVTLTPEQTANKLSRIKDQVIAEFVERAHKELASAKTDRDSLVDSLPFFLDNLITTLKEGKTAENLIESSNIGGAHGRERASHMHYDLNDILIEYRILTRILFDFFRSDNERLDDLSEKIILDAIHRGIGNASSEFIKYRNEIDQMHEKELNDFFEQSPIPMCILIGPEHLYTLANPAYEELLKKDVVGKTVREVFSKHEADDFIPLLDEVLKTGKPYIGREQPFKIVTEKETRTRILNFGYHPFRDLNGNIKGIMAIVADVTEHIQLRMMVEEDNKRFQEIANALPLIVWTADKDFNVDWYNDWWYSYLNLPRGTTWDDSVKQPMHPEEVELTKQALQEAKAKGSNISLEQRFRRGIDGQYRWHLVRVVAVKDKNGKVIKWVGANTDIHDQKMIHQRLNEERDLREKFVAMLSHDLRTPLAAAKMSAQLISRKNEDPSIQKLAFRISELMDRADHMIRDLLDASLINAGERLTLKFKKINITELIRDTVDELSSIHGHRFIFIDGEEIAGEVDPEALRRILENLCNNAIKYGDNRKDVIVSIKSTNDQVIIDVHNEGNPIKKSEQEKLFDQFKRADKVKHDSIIGWGLGLTLVRGLVEAHNGKVSVQSEEKKGTTFTVVIPLNQNV